MRILISIPLSFPETIQFPKNFISLGSEAQMSWRFHKALKTKYSDTVLRVYLAIKLFLMGKKTDIFITGRYGEYFALLQGIAPWARRTPHVLLDVEWYGESRSRFVRVLKRMKQKLMIHGAYKVGVFCEVEAKKYAEYYQVPRDKFIWIPYCTDLSVAEYQPKESDYIFSGGIHQRDFKTLYKAVKDLDEEIRICAPAGSIPKKYISDNMCLIDRIPREEYFRQIAEAKFVILSLFPYLRRCPGVITYVAAMKLGKAVIVNEIEGSRSYIKNGVTGLIVPPCDHREMKKAILNLSSDDLYRNQIADQALQHANENFSQARLTADLFDVVKTIDHGMA